MARKTAPSLIERLGAHRPCYVSAAGERQGRWADERVIVEHEIIEQVEEEPRGRSFGWVCRFARGMGRDDPMTILERLWRSGYLAMIDSGGRELPSWRVEQLWRDRNEEWSGYVMATDLGSQWVHG